MVTDFATLMLKETPDAVIVTTPQGEVACWSNGARGVSGDSGTQALGHTLLELIVPDDRAEHGRDIPRQTFGCGFAGHASLRRAKDGAPVDIDSAGKAVYDGAGRIDYILWSRKDVTQVLRDAKLVQTGFGALRESTPAAVVMADAAGRVALVNRRAEARFGYGRGAMRGRLLAALLPKRFRDAQVFCRGDDCPQASDARAPLNADQERRLQTIQGGARHLPSLIDELLDLTRIASGKVPWQGEPLSCLRLIEDLLPIFRPQAPAEGVVLRADRRALQQIMINLINNATRFTERGEIAVALRRCGSTRGARCRSAWPIRAGAAPAKARPGCSRHFPRSTAAPRDRWAEPGWSGPGLYPSQRLAAVPGGRLMFQSEFGRGSIFTLALPME